MDVRSLILLPIGTAVVVTALCIALWKLIDHWLSRWAAKAKTNSLSSAGQSAGRILLPLCFIVGIYAGIKISNVPEPLMGTLDKVMISLLILVCSLLAAGIAGIAVTAQAQRSKMTMPLTSLAHNTIRGFILLIGVLVVLDTLGVKITSLIAALGIGSLAVALALQDTLSNLFAGAYIILSRNICTGHYIKVDSGVEGYVVDIGWRSTIIRPFENTLVIIPNSRLSQSIVTNYNLPDPWIQIALPLNVSYDTDIEKLEEILIEEGKKAVKEVPGMLPEFQPVVRFSPGFGDFSLNFLLVFRVKEFVDQYIVQHELRKRILKRFRQEGIEIPFPIRTVRMSEPTIPRGGAIDRDHKPDENSGTVS